MEFPSEIQQFDITTISDVALPVRCTANDGVSALLEVRNDCANEWRHMLATGSRTMLQVFRRSGLGLWF